MASFTEWRKQKKEEEAKNASSSTKQSFAEYRQQKHVVSAAEPMQTAVKQELPTLSGGKKFRAADVVGKYQDTHGDNEILSQDPRYKMRFTNVALEQQKRDAVDDALDELLGRQQTAQKEMEFFDSGEFKGPSYLAAEQLYNQIQQQIEAENRKAMSQQQIDEIKAFQEMERWQSATGRKGYGQASAYAPNDDLQYNVINRDPDAVAKSHEEAAKYNLDIAGVDMGHLERMTDEEIGLYNYYYSTEGKEKADEYLASIESDLKARRMGARREWYREYAEQNPVAASAFSVLTSPARGLSYVGQAADYLKGGKMDANESYNIFARAGSDIRGQVSSDIEKNVEGFWGKAGSFAYNTGMSMGDFLMAAGLSGGVGGVATTIMGTGAAAQTVLDAKDRGLDDNQAFALGTIAGVAEALTEKFSIEALLDRTAMGKGALTYILKNAITEGSEEAASGIINTVADILISKDKSEWSQSVEDYKAQGMSEKEAFWRAVADQAKSIGLDALGGVLSGGLVGSVGAIGNTAVQKAEQPKKGAEIATEMGIGKNGAEVAQEAGINAENIGAFTANYEAGKDGKAFEEVKTVQTGIDENTARQAFNAGQMDALAEGNTEQEVNENEKRNESGRNGSERQIGMAPAERSGGVPEGTGSVAERREARRLRAEEIRRAVEASGQVSTSAAAEGIAEGTTRNTMKRVPARLWTDEIRQMVHRQSAKGVQVIPFVGEMEFRDKRGTYTARGAVSRDGKRMWVCVDDLEVDFSQIEKHEDFHVAVKKDKNLFENTRKAVVDKYGTEQLDKLVDMYVSFYGWGNLDVDYVVEEILADAYAEINAFDSTGQFEGANRFADVVSESVDSAQLAENAIAEDGVRAAQKSATSFVPHKYYSRIISNIENQNPTGYTLVGEIPAGGALREVGFVEGNVYFDNSKILAELKKEKDPLPKSYLQRVPEILANPIVIVQSQYDNTASVFGEVRRNNVPVVVGIMVAKDRSGRNVINKIRTVHSRGHAQSLINDDTVLYLSKNKNKTKEWFQASRIEMPLGGTKFGLIRTLPLTEDVVKAAEKKSQKATNEQIAAFIEKYGAIEPGENPFRTVQVPKKTGETEKVSYTARTAMEAEATAADFVPLIENEIVKGGFSFVPVSNDETTKKAKGFILGEGWQSAWNLWSADVKMGKADNVTVAIGALLYNHAVNAGDYKTAMDVLTDYQVAVRNSARGLQAARILKKLSPDARLYMINKDIQKLVEELKLDEPIELPQSLVDQYMKAKTNKEIDNAVGDIQEYVAAQIPSTGIDMWTALRYTNMLGNFKTQVRNVAGNVGMRLVSEVENAAALAVEKLAGGKLGKTRAIFVDKELRQLAKDDFANVRAEAMGETRYTLDNATASSFLKGVQDKKTVFKRDVKVFGKDLTLPKAFNVAIVPMEYYRKATNWAMNNAKFGDEGFTRPAYARALGEYLKANGVTAQQFGSDTWQQKHGDFLDKARQYAVARAQELTFRDHNAFSNAIASLGRKPTSGKWTKVLSEGVLPFRRTPANVLVRAEEYSPLGLINTAIKAAQLAKGKENVTGNDVVNSLAKTITGTGIFLVGMAMHNMGLLRGGDDEDEKVARMDDLMGHQTYALEIGGTSYTLDWLTPTAMPLFMGAQLNKLIEDGGFELKDIYDALVSLADPMLQMSMLSGLNDTLDNIRYIQGNGLLQIALNAGIDYLTQGLTNSLLGQLDRTLKDVSEMTFVDSQGDLPTFLQKELGAASRKVPVWDYSQIPYIDAWGRTESNGSVPGRILKNFVSPGYVSDIGGGDLEDEILELYQLTGDGGVFPSTADKHFPVKGEEVYLNADEYVRYATKKGQLSYEIAEKIMKSGVYRGMSDEEKAEAISDAYALANVIAKKSVSKYETEGWKEKAVAAKKIGIDYSKYLEARLTVKDIESLKDADGDTITSSKGLQIMEAIYNIKGLNDKQRKQLFEDFGVGKTIIDLNKAAVEAKLKNMR